MKKPKYLMFFEHFNRRRNQNTVRGTVGLSGNALKELYLAAKSQESPSSGLPAPNSPWQGEMELCENPGNHDDEAFQVLPVSPVSIMEPSFLGDQPRIQNG